METVVETGAEMVETGAEMVETVVGAVILRWSRLILGRLRL